MFLSLPLVIDWNAITALGTIGATAAASIAAYFAYKTWKLESQPVVQATGTFIISTVSNTNGLRDAYISKSESPHTLQVVNVGRGPAKNVALSVQKDIIGFFLEDINPPSFPLPANKGTKEFSEILRVHGQRFVMGDEYGLEFKDYRNTAYFYIHFEDHFGKRYITKVTINKVKQVDDQDLDKHIKTKHGIEVWKVMKNITETLD